MPEIILETLVNASAETCFDLIRDPRIHTETTAQTNESVGLGQTVTFESKYFGMRQRLTLKVVEFDRPGLFVDEMIEGRFRSFLHKHEFFPQNGKTLMRDTFTWTPPLGILGTLVDKLLLERHLRKLVTTRNARLKEIAESHCA